MEAQVTYSELMGFKPEIGEKKLYTLVYELVDDTDDIVGWLFGSTPSLLKVLDANDNDLFDLIDQATVTRLESLIAKKRKQDDELAKLDRAAA